MSLLQTLPSLPSDAAYDLVVIGAGGAGLSAALHAAIDGAKVLVVERTAHVGGTTAWSAGTTWIPCTRHAKGVADEDSLERAARYLDRVVGDHADAALRRAFLAHGAEAVERFEQHSDVHYRPYALHPDYESDVDGSTLRGRALEPLPFDGRQLGALFGLLRPPIPEFTVLGGMMVDRTDINHLLSMGRSWPSLRHAVKIVARHAHDRLRHPRGTRLVMGNALVARLLHSLAQRPRVTLLMDTQMREIHVSDGHPGPGRSIEAVTLESAGTSRRIAVRGGLALASGGINRDPVWRERHLPGIPMDWCPGAPGHTGQAQALALQIGARHGQGAASPTFWAPVSRRQRADGSTAVFPHFVMDRAKPGMLTVNQAGRRYLNESMSYHRYGLAMQAEQCRSEAGEPGAAAALPSWIVCDAAALKRHGLGMVRPGGGGLAPFIADGYLRHGATLADLAHQLGMDAATLEATVATHNRHAEAGHDPDFQRGVTAYQRNIGDATWPGRNPNLGALTAGPYYAVQVVPGDIGAAVGLQTDDQARVLDAQGMPIGGLYAVGNDAQSIMGGTYPGPGITIGPGMVFGFLAARDAWRRCRSA
ncbi:FAD-dependent oxidoreductase [Sphaerotilus mobilis]|uniref:Succinate dehydrogenase/fumarate reductase flavoprotein subunit n=1 Tax=Sphaerotilus mobilis TaxID=47994 RepID=A0A4Q7LS23_9BURK|nr:FAD-dependent oxidoreductase [Sphaerotilus mobilis]RZS57223.1 succinate dehydrogenase/fumarate reductase flavoprotein subunit [Sphaerotilus mobilis]